MNRNILTIIQNIKNKTDNLVSDAFDTYNEYSKYFDNYLSINNNNSNMNEEIYNFESERLRKFLIDNFWMLPNLLENYGISQEEIDMVITPLQQRQKEFANKSEMDTHKMSIIFNDIYSDYSNKTLFDVGIIDDNGFPKINPVAFCYSNKQDNTIGDSEILKAMEKSYEYNEIDKESKSIRNISKLKQKFNCLENKDELFSKKHQDDLINYFCNSIDVGYIKNIHDMSADEYYEYLDNNSIHKVFKYFIEHKENKNQD